MGSDTRKIGRTVATLEKMVAPRTRPEPLTPPPARNTSEDARRRELALEVLRDQLLMGLSGADTIAPALALSELEASLMRARIADTSGWRKLAAEVASGGLEALRAHFGTAASEVAWIFGLGARPEASNAPLPATSVAEWRAARWAAFLASEAGKAEISQGRLIVGAAVDAAEGEPDAN